MKTVHLIWQFESADKVALNLELKNKWCLKGDCILNSPKVGLIGIVGIVGIVG